MGGIQGKVRKSSLASLTSFYLLIVVFGASCPTL